MEQLLTTKLYFPPTRPELVPRPSLIEQLTEGLHRKLTLISAPAGFGKTTLVSEWVEILQLDPSTESQTAYRIAWFSLDEGDNDAARFLAYFIAALNHSEGIKAPLGEGILSRLQSPQSPPASSNLLPAATVLYWTTWSKKSWNSNLKASRHSCCKLQFLIDILAPCVMLSLARTTARQPWKC